MCVHAKGGILFIPGNDGRRGVACWADHACVVCGAAWSLMNDRFALLLHSSIVMIRCSGDGEFHRCATMEWAAPNWTPHRDPVHILTIIKKNIYIYPYIKNIGKGWSSVSTGGFRLIYWFCLFLKMARRKEICSVQFVLLEKFDQSIK